MKKFGRAARAALFAFVMASVGMFASWASAQLRHEPMTFATAKGPVVFDVEFADTPEQQAKGLMFRTSLPEKSGMLFSYTPPREILMWMKNTYIPLDMVFITAEGVVLRIEPMTQPFSEDKISSEGTAAAVLEINGGAAARLGIKPGDRVQHALFQARGK